MAGRRNYDGRRVDLVVAAGQEAVEFLASGNPWPGAPVLYSDVGPLASDLSRSLPAAEELIFQDHFRAALGVIKKILPDTERVGLIYAASPGEHSRYQGFAGRVRDAGLGLEPVELNGLVMEDLLERVAHMPAHTVLFLFNTQVDAAGRAFQPMRACELVAAAANRPLFSLQRHELGCGIVGGLLGDIEVTGRLLGERALVILDSESTAEATVPAERYSTLVFDARQLERWHIDERRLPAGSRLEFREPSLWRDYRAQVVAISGVAVLQTVLLAWLLFEQRRRRRAEVDSRRLAEAARGRELTIAHLDRRAAIGEVTTAITHEVNQPLEAILHNAEAAEMLLDSGRLSEGELREILADIRRIDARAGSIVQRMRGLLRKKEFETQPIDLNELTRDTVAFVMPVAGSRGVRLGLELAGDLEPIAGDRIHLQQVLLNILLNGIEATSEMPREGRHLDVTTLRCNGRIEVAVRDRGHGIPAEPIAQIFEPFFTTKGEGMGIGLSIARTIVEAHGGRIAARNNPDGGATVWFTLPSSGRPADAGCTKGQ